MDRRHHSAAGATGRLFAACAALLLANCEAATGEAPVPEAPANAPATALAGSYEITMGDGTIIRETLAPDGTYVDTKDGVEFETGTWRTSGALLCFDPRGSDPEVCFAHRPPQANGAYAVIGPDGKETGSIVRRIE